MEEGGEEERVKKWNIYNERVERKRKKAFIYL